VTPNRDWENGEGETKGKEKKETKEGSTMRQ